VTAVFPGFDGQPAFSPDGRTLAVTRADHVALLEVVTGQVRHVFRHNGPVEPALAWRADGRVLAAASAEAPVYLWDVVGDRTANVPPWTPAVDPRLWADLTGTNAGPAFDALRQLWGHPVEAVAFLRGRVPVHADTGLAARACEALELPATDDAMQLLASWAAGPVQAPRTREARESLRRLNVALKPTSGGGGRG
jgi:hypothetical protein